MPIPFLSARWSNLILITYAVPPELLRPYLPDGIALDTRDGQSFASLVAFDFLDTRVLGVPWPGFRTFAEMIAECIAGDGIVHVFGSGHSHMMAEEVFHRAGGLSACRLRNDVTANTRNARRSRREARRHPMRLQRAPLGRRHHR